MSPFTMNEIHSGVWREHLIDINLNVMIIGFSCYGHRPLIRPARDHLVDSLLEQLAYRS